MRHAVEQAAWGRDTTTDLANDFYRWASDGKDGAAAPPEVSVNAGEAMPAEGREEPSARPVMAEPARGQDWDEFEAWLDGKGDPGDDAEVIEPEPELELGD